MSVRIPFIEAITEKALLKGVFDQLTVPQQTALKVYYGLPLLKEEERKAWAVFQEQCTYDHLGYVLSWREIPYTAKEYEQAHLVFGRRSGKTDKFGSIVLTYEATMGGHEQYVREGQEVVCFMVAQNLKIASKNLAFVRQNLMESPLLKKRLKNDTAEGLLIDNGILIAPAAPSVKAQRGLASPVIVMDEIGFWYKDAESANPDIEVERALSWSQAQFPHRKRISTTTPWTQEGLGYKYHTAGTEGCKLDASADKTEFRDILAMHSTTAFVAPPHLISKDFLEKDRARDVEAFERESLARFVNAVSGFLSPTLLQELVEHGVAERPKLPRPDHPEDPKPYYVAAADPAFRSDSFAFTILHHDEKLGMVQDVVKEFKPVMGQPLNPTMVLDGLLPLVEQYGIKVIFTDQYQFDALDQLVLQRGIALEKVDFTGRSKAKIFGSLQHLVNTKRLRLLDPKKNPDAATQMQQLVLLQKKMTGLGNMQISAPQGRHDDLATVLALACYKAVWLLGQPGTTEPDRPKAKSHVQLGLEQIKRKREMATRGTGLEDW